MPSYLIIVYSYLLTFFIFLSWRAVANKNKYSWFICLCSAIITPIAWFIIIYSLPSTRCKYLRVGYTLTLVVITASVLSAFGNMGYPKQVAICRFAWYIIPALLLINQLYLGLKNRK